jgi:hypothetical protein
MGLLLADFAIGLISFPDELLASHHWVEMVVLYFQGFNAVVRRFSVFSRHFLRLLAVGAGFLQHSTRTKAG